MTLIVKQDEAAYPIDVGFLRTQRQALSALLFLYRHVLEKEFGWLEDVVRAKTDKHVPEVFAHPEAVVVLANLNGVNWLIGSYAC